MPDINFECPSCKQPLEAPGELANELIECPSCHATIEVPTRTRQAMLDVAAPTLPAPALQMEVLPPARPAKSLDSEEPVRCPRCQSSQITANPKGFGLGKAVIGGLLLGPIGLLGGVVGKNEITITCLKCGHVFEPGS